MTFIAAALLAAGLSAQTADDKVMFGPAGLWKFCKANSLGPQNSPLCFKYWKDGEEPYSLMLIASSPLTARFEYVITGLDKDGSRRKFEGRVDRSPDFTQTITVIHCGELTAVSITIHEIPAEILSYTVAR
jgi:hypothetical protein